MTHVDCITQSPTSGIWTRIKEVEARHANGQGCFTHTMSTQRYILERYPSVDCGSVLITILQVLTRVYSLSQLDNSVQLAGGYAESVKPKK